MSVCGSVLALRQKRLELSTPKCVHIDIYFVAGRRHALTQSSKGQRSVLSMSCRRGAARRYDCLGFESVYRTKRYAKPCFIWAMQLIAETLSAVDLINGKKE